MVDSPSFLVRSPRVAMLALLAATLAGCGSIDGATRGMASALTMYRPEVVQGNFVSREQVQALQTGMTRLQVRDILGTPLMASVFHANRWDYVFTMKRQRVDPQQYRLTLFFNDDLLERFEGDEMPSETEFVERISPKRTVKVPMLEATEEQLAKFPTSQSVEDAKSAPSATALPPAAGNYPPLEPAR